MIKVYTHWEDLNKAPYSIFSNEAAFKAFCGRPEIYTEYVRDVMKSLDKAVMIDVHTRTLKTPEGIVGVERLSTGCKTVINAICCVKFKNIPAVINANDCDSRAMLELFKVADNRDVSLLIMKPHIPKELHWRFTVDNDREIVDCFNLERRLLGIS